MKYRLYEGVILEHVDESDVLVTESGDAAILNEAAYEIVCLLIQGVEKIDILQTVYEKYDVQYQTIEQDVSEFIDDLLDKKIIEAV